MKDEFKTESEKSPETIEREIDEQRAHISHIVDALGSKFTPGQMLDQALGLVKGNGAEFFGNLGTTVRNNPVPTVLTTVGLCWLMLGQNHPPRVGYRVGPDQDASGWSEGLSGGLDSARSHLHDTTNSLRDGFHQLKDKASHLADGLGASARHARHSATQTGDRLAHGSQDLGDQFSRLLKEQPLMMAAAGIALGAMLGAALPSTSTEQRVMGKTSAGLADKAKQKAREGYETVRDTVSKTTEHRDEPSPAPATGHAHSGADLSGGLGTS
jgi:X-X-X-Leu-X-X-Gly heptad repeat protein